MSDCAHGAEVFCYYALSPATREMFDAYHRHAYDWALEVYGMTGDYAERYAGFYASWNYDDDHAPSHALELERWLKLEGVDRYAVCE